MIMGKGNFPLTYFSVTWANSAHMAGALLFAEGKGFWGQI